MTLHQSVIDALTSWQPADPADEALRQAVLGYVLARSDACERACAPGHVTASALVLDHTGTRAALTLHPRLGRWVQLGGHCEPGDVDIVAAAWREATEESGITGLRIDPDLAALHVHPVTCSLGIPTRHLDMQFIARAPEGAELVCSDESIDLRWWPLHEVPGGDYGLTRLVAQARRR
jgi:8-oxo-dGTP pyrophosphatase MutT (NUDIX family)